MDLVEALKNHAQVIENVVAALIELEGMKAENAVRASKGESPAYGEDAFNNLLKRSGIGFNNLPDGLEVKDDRDN